MKRSSLAMIASALTACGGESRSEPAMETSDQRPEPPTTSVEKTDAEWREQLSPEQYRILRQEGTEQPGGKVYEEFQNQGTGTYYCAGCNAELFSSREKFDSHCGWPSFYDPANAKNIKTSTDYKLGYPRTEVRCAVCDGHLGHVFEGEGFDTPTDQRYCINGIILKFVPDETDTPAAEAAAGSEKEIVEE